MKFRSTRAFPIWATLRAYGKDGYRAMVERHLGLATRLGALVEQAPDLELLAPVRSCVVCLRYRPEGVHGLLLYAPTLKLDGWSMPWYSRVLQYVRPLPIRFEPRPGAFLGEPIVPADLHANTHWTDVVPRVSSLFLSLDRQKLGATS